MDGPDDPIGIERRLRIPTAKTETAAMRSILDFVDVPGPDVPVPHAFECAVCEHVGFDCGGH